MPPAVAGYYAVLAVLLFAGEYAVRFIPRENGAYLVYVSFESCQTDVSRG